VQGQSFVQNSSTVCGVPECAQNNPLHIHRVGRRGQTKKERLFLYLSLFPAKIFIY
jgi:hypothetical protein